MTMLASVVYVRNPFDTVRDREVIELRRRRRLDKLAPTTPAPFICLRNGQAVLRKDWRRTHVDDGDVVQFVTLMQGGGGGGKKNPLMTIAMLAVAFVAPYAAGALFPGLANAAAGTFGAFAFRGITAVIGFVGSSLVSAAFGKPPSQPSNLQAQSIAAPSPTYNVQAQGNAARLGQAIPVQYGRHLVYPDFAATPYTEYAGNEQYLYQLYCLGQGERAIEAIRIEDTPIGNFEEVTTETIGPGGTVTLFPTNVIASIEVAGQEIEQDTYIGPFVANDAATLANKLAIDVVLPAGLYYANDQGGLSEVTVTFEASARAIDDLGAPAGDWAVLGAETITAATNTPIRKSYYYTVTAARYEVRVKRTNAKQQTTRAADAIAWAGLRSYLPGIQDYGNVTVLAVRMRATNQLSAQASRRLNVISTRKLAAWDPATGWAAAAATRSIAWALADACRAEYGPQLADARLDLEELAALHTIWEARGDHFDGVFDSTIGFWEALTQIARAGRAKPYIQGGVIHFARDRQSGVPVALFNYRNMAPGSFEAEYLLPGEETPDAVEGEYFNAVTWKPDRVLAELPEYTAERPATVRFFGITDHDHCWREGMYEAAANRWRRRPMKFTTEMEGFIPSPLDLVAIARDRPNLGQSAEILAWEAGTRTATLSEPVVWTAAVQHYVGLRRRDGGFAGPYAVSRGADDATVILATAPSLTPDTGFTREKTLVAFGAGESYRILARVVGLRPRGLHQVEITCINEDDRVHTADQTTAPLPSLGMVLAGNVSRPVVQGLTVIQGGTPDAPVIFASWLPARSAEYYLVQQSTDGASWIDVGQPTAARLSFAALPGVNYVRVAGVGLQVGAWATWSGVYGAGVYGANPIFTIPNVTGLELFNQGPVTTFTGRDAKFAWRASSTTGASELGSERFGAGDGYADRFFAYYEVRIEKTDGTLLRNDRAANSTYTYSFEKNYEDTNGAPVREFRIKVWQRGRDNQRSLMPAQLTVSNPQPALPGAVSVEAGFKQLIFKSTRPSDTDWDGLLVWMSVTAGFTPGAGNLKYKGPDPVVQLDGIAGETYYLRYASFDSFGATGVTLSGELSQTVLQIVDADIAANQIRETHLFEDLGERINLIDADAVTPGSVANRIEVEAAARIAAVSAEAAARATALVTETSDRVAAIAAEALTRATADTTELNIRSDLAVQLRGGYTGTDLSLVTSGLVHSERVARVAQDTSMAAEISLLFASVAGSFDPYQTWYFDGGVEGWQADGTTTLGYSNGFLTYDSTGTTPGIALTTDLSPGVTGNQYRAVKLRVKRTAGAGWSGKVQYKTAGHGFSASYYKTVADPVIAIGDFAVVAWDMTALTVGTTDWLTSTILNLRIELGATSADDFEVDWISVGRDAPGASTASVLTEASVRATADSAEATARQLVSSKTLGTVDPTTITNLADLSSGILYEERTTRTTQDTALSTLITALTSTVTTNNTTLTSSITTEATARASGDATNASAITALTSTVSGVSASLATETSTRATADTALASSIAALSATVGANSASITSESTTRASADLSLALGVNAVAASVTTLTSSVGSNSASISIQATTLNGLSTQYTVKIDNNGYVTGFGLASEAINGTPVSTFLVRADRFAIAAAGVSAIVPFIVSGGVTYIAQAVIKDADITTLKIAGNAVTVPASGSGSNGASVAVSVVAGSPITIIGVIEGGDVFTEAVTLHDLALTVDGSPVKAIALFNAFTGTTGYRKGGGTIVHLYTPGAGGTFTFAVTSSNGNPGTITVLQTKR